MRHPAWKDLSSTEQTGAKWRFGPVVQTAPSAEHVHEFDEYMVVVQGCYTVIIDGQRIPLNAGSEYSIPRGVTHSGEETAGTRIRRTPGGPSLGEFTLPW